MTSTSAISPLTVPIQVTDLTVKFGRTAAISSVNLTLQPGSIFALIGPNGAGKTTLIKVLLNILRPTSGTAVVQGLTSTQIAGHALETIGYVSENQELPGWMTVSALLRYLQPFYPGWDRDLERELLSQLQVPADRKIKHLSRGQRMKAALLSVLPYRPSLIVLDEPFSGLDPLARDEFVEGLLDRAAAQYDDPPTILISSHDLAEIESFATHVGFLDGGRLLFSEEVATLTSRFREVTVTTSEIRSTESTRVMQRSFPASWLLPETGPSFSRFIHSQATAEPIEQQLATAFPGASNIQVEPMSLRSIFLALAKSSRAKDTATTERSRA